MIFADSRYATGNIYKTFVPRLKGNSIVVDRVYPTDRSKFYFYQVGLGERIESIAQETLGDANLWYAIMDYNPEVINPFNIPLGTVIRVPYEL